jgi:hypothetical protein
LDFTIGSNDKLFLPQLGTAMQTLAKVSDSLFPIDFSYGIGGAVTISK